ncbi:MAG: DUF459 domain-containing protein [Boseongicola sp. SB0677_bin_26]|nr:DUF459 domain-containing protein [Boseongicola sp. SB0677_bin_26]
MLNCSRSGRTGISAALLAVAVLLCQACAPQINAQDLASALFTGLPGKKDNPGALHRELSAQPRRQLDAESPARILVIGDSLGSGIGFFLRERVKARGLHATVINAAKSSTGLSRRDHYDWPREFRALAVAHSPDIVVAHFGANDMQAVVRPDGLVRFGSPDWAAAYREEIRKILSAAAEARALLYWVGPGPDRNTKLNRHLSRVNSLFEEEAEAGGAVYIPVSSFAATPEGGYVRKATINQRTVTIRSGDGSHFTGEGYSLIADRLLEEMERRVPAMFGRRDDLFAALQ